MDFELFYDQSELIELSRYQNLYSAVILQSIWDCRTRNRDRLQITKKKGTGVLTRHDIVQSIRFLDDKTGHFDFICEMAGYEPDYMRMAIRRLRKRRLLLTKQDL